MRCGISLRHKPFACNLAVRQANSHTHTLACPGTVLIAGLSLFSHQCQARFSTVGQQVSQVSALRSVLTQPRQCLCMSLHVYVCVGSTNCVCVLCTHFIDMTCHSQPLAASPTLSHPGHLSLADPLLVICFSYTGYSWAGALPHHYHSLLPRRHGFHSDV